jgi:hypothetical protein
MRIEVTGRRPAVLAVTRIAMAALALAATAGLGACTTVEGTNAMTDFGTFEREVMTSTLQGLGAVPQETKEPLVSHRGPLVLPKSNAALPPPQSTDVAEAQLPEDSTAVQIDMSQVSEEDLTRLRKARVVDLRTMAGRPLTDEETRQLTARFQGAQIKGKRSLIIPPDDYFTVVNGTELICLAEDGKTLVAVTDKRCPSAIRRALGPKAPKEPGLLGDFDSNGNL